jgi:hypothetical protein
MYKILVSDSLSEEGLKIFNENKEFEVTVKTGYQRLRRFGSQECD